LTTCAGGLRMKASFTGGIVTAQMQLLLNLPSGVG
jgi:hypothetical protein